VLDPAGYGAITITKALSIVNDGVGTAGVQQTQGTDAITVNADGKSGSLNITMPQSAPTADPNSTVKVTGTWSS